MSNRSLPPLADDRPGAAVPHAGRLRWPLPAVFTWACGWAVWQVALAAGAAPASAVLAALAACGGCAWCCCSGRLRRAIAAGGFPAALVVWGAAPALPAWAWPALLLPLAAAYPLRAWRDAPFFPTPVGALDGIDRVVLPPPRSVLDAGCGAGHGLAALRRAWPRTRLHGVEWSALLAWVARLRCRGATILRGDMWAAGWACHDAVYLFQRPESMARAWAKACAEMHPGAVLISLEFAVPGVAPAARLDGGGRPVWIYRVPGGAGSTGAGRSR